MNPFFRLPVVIALLALAWLPRLSAQDTSLPIPSTDSAPPGSTVITADELRADENTHVSVFTGDVTVTGTNFTLTCDEMTVYSDKANKIQRIVCVGNVVINQPGRVTHCGRSEYFAEDDKFVLTDQPSIVDGKNQYYSPKIVIYRSTQQISLLGKGSKVILGGGALGSSTKTTPPAPARSTP